MINKEMTVWVYTYRAVEGQHTEINGLPSALLRQAFTGRL
jgi:hypothetical protein